MTKFLTSWAVGFFLLGSGLGLAQGNPRPGTPESIKAYGELRDALIQRLGPVVVQNPETDSVAIPSHDCDITIKGLSADSKRFGIQVSRGSSEISVSSFLGDAVTFKKSAHGFTSEMFQEDCEEEGCDGLFYLGQRLFVGSKIMEFGSISYYSREIQTISCTLKSN